MMCDSGEVEDIGLHFLIGFTEFGKEWKTLEELRGYEGLENGWRSLRGWASRGRWHCCWERGMREWIGSGKVYYLLAIEVVGRGGSV